MKTLLLTTAVVSMVCASQAYARDQIRVVGSSTVFPFATAVAESFGNNTSYPTPVIESTGSGGGLKLFCAGLGTDHPDITNASRAIKSNEIELCASNGVTKITEVMLGFDGIVLANSKSGDALSLTIEQIFAALADQLPNADGSLAPNPNMHWSDIDASLPATKIEVLGPPPTSGTRDAFVELVMETGCEAYEGVTECTKIREDGVFVEAGENDNLIVQKLAANPAALGIFGFSFLDQNADKVQGAWIDGTEPTFENIASGDYPVSRSLFFYVKNDHVDVIPGMRDYLTEFTSEAAIGEEGYLTDKGLIPASDETRELVRNNAANLVSLSN